MALTSGETHLRENIIGLFNAIRSKASVSGSMTFAQAASAVEGISGGGNNLFDLFVEGSLPSIISGNVSIIRNYAFCNADSRASYPYAASIREVIFPEVTYIGNNAFESTNLTTAFFPECVTVSSNAFRSCKFLSDVTIPKCVSIGSYAFQWDSSLSAISIPYCESLGRCALERTGLTSIELPRCGFIPYECFEYCSSLSSVVAPIVTEIGSSAFYSCPNLEYIYLPLVDTLYDYALGSCSKLQSAVFSLCKSISSRAFYGCSALSMVSFPNVTYIGSSVFYNCNSLVSLYFLTSTVPTVSGTYQTFPTTVYTTTGSGQIFVKESLYNSFISASVWSQVKTHIISLTDSEINELALI